MNDKEIEELEAPDTTDGVWQELDIVLTRKKVEQLELALKLACKRYGFDDRAESELIAGYLELARQELEDGGN